MHVSKEFCDGHKQGLSTFQEPGVGKGSVSELLVAGPLSMGSSWAQPKWKHGSILTRGHHPQGERQQAGFGLLIAPQSLTNVLEFTHGV